MTTAELLLIAGRVLLGALFVTAGITHLRAWRMIAGAVGKRVPVPNLVLGLGTGFQLIAGALLVAGVFVTPAALGLVGFTLAASVLMLNFWDMDGAERHAAVNQWLTNAGVIGGLLLAAASGL